VARREAGAIRYVSHEEAGRRLGLMGLAFMGAIVLPVYLVPALTVVLALGLAAGSRPAVRWPQDAARQLTPPLSLLLP
jgi:hypothetical protein